MIIAAKQRAVAQRGRKALNDAALQGNDGLDIDARTLATTALDAPVYRPERITYPVDDIASGVG
jgi:hypothetical protein